MLQVVKVVEGGIDFRSLEQLPRSLVISNGRREVEISATDEDIEKVVQLFAEVASMDSSVGTAPPPKPRNREPVRSPEPEQPVNRNWGLSQEEEEPEISEPDGFEPGEAYSDSGTGVGSL
jgi:hypothetical protein